MSKFVMIIFGASGDLTKRKLMPALYSLYKDNRLPEELRLIRGLAGSKCLSMRISDCKTEEQKALRKAYNDLSSKAQSEIIKRAD